MAGDLQQARDSTVESIDGDIRIEIEHASNGNQRVRGDPNNNLSISLSTVRMESIKVAQRTASQVQTSQELRMLSSVTLNCQVTQIVMNSGSQLSKL